MSYIYDLPFPPNGERVRVRGRIKVKKKIDVEYIANLARIRLSRPEIESFSGELGDIISYIEQLSKVDTKDTGPTTHPVPLANVFREDEVKDSLHPDKALSNAPKRKDNFFKVPKVIEEG